MHFYDRDGNSKHTIIGKNGKERSTTIKDARELGLVPSVTTVQSMLANHGLANWLQNELLDAAIDNPWHPENGENVKLWKKKTLEKMKEKGKKAADVGTEVHDILEGIFKGGHSTLVKHTKSPYWGAAAKAQEYIEKEFPNRKWVAEQSFCSKEFGYGGCVDLYSRATETEPAIIIDFKTKDKKNLEGVEQYDSHKVQLAAYQMGLGLKQPVDCIKRYNLFISVHEESPGYCKLIEAKEFVSWWVVFESLLNVWKVVNKYNPSEII